MLTFLDPALLAKVVLYVGVINVALSAAKTILDKVAAGSPADGAVAKAVAIVNSIVDFLSANVPH